MTQPTAPSDDSARSLRDRAEAFLNGTGGQLVRYAITGFGITLVGSAIYYLLATMLGMREQIANLIQYAVSVTIGYVIHGRWSFRGHGRREDARRTKIRFFVASLISLGLNSVWIWILVERLHQPTWSPILCFMFVTPFAMFWLNRMWVFE